MSIAVPDEHSRNPAKNQEPPPTPRLSNLFFRFFGYGLSTNRVPIDFRDPEMLFARVSHGSVGFDVLTVKCRGETVG